jgi:CubicO group peptidase (beta-lactamase class C family)
LARWLVLLTWVPVSLTACAGESPSTASVESEIDRILSEEYPASQPGASFLVAKAGDVILKKGYGLADIERGTTVTPGTVFRIASLTKMFTSTAILMLAEQGRLGLDDPLTRHLPDYPASGQGVAIHHLLTHASGLAEYLDRPDFMEWVGSERTVMELIDSFKDRPSSFGPGERDAYSNSNYILLGAIIEQVSGLSFAEFVRASIFDPLGMRSTSCGGPLRGIAGLAEAYEPALTAADEPDWTRPVVARPYTMSALYAAGGCVSSVEDLFVFHEALLRGRLLSQVFLAQSFVPVELRDGSAGGTAYGGWQLDRIDGHRAAMKGGSMPGACTWFLMVPDDSLAVILLSNRTPGRPRCGMLTVRLAGIALGG